MKDKKSIAVQTNKNIETIGIILILSDFGDYILEKYGGDDEYKLVKSLRLKFSPFRDHFAIKKINHLIQLNAISFGFYYYGLYFSEVPDFKQTSDQLSLFYVNDSLPKDQMEKEFNELNGYIKQFYTDASIEMFLNDNKEAYSKIMNEVKNVMPQDHLIQEMESFFGVFQNEYVINPSPTIFSGFNFGPHINSGDNVIYYHVCGPFVESSTLRDTFPSWESIKNFGFEEKESIAQLAIHEFGHTFLRFLDQEDYKLEIKKLEHLNVSELRNNMVKIGYSEDWMNAFEEHLLRAAEIVIWENLGEKEFASEKFENELNDEGLIYLDQFLQALRKYNQHRDQYKSLELYFEFLIADIKMIDNAD